MQPTNEPENYKICVNYAFSHFKYHRFLSVNSHEIKRDIDGICEKLRFSNLHDSEKKFRKLVEESVSHELAVNHYEKDAIYAVLNLLTNLAFDPVNNLKSQLRKGEEIIKFKPTGRKTPAKASDAFMSSLLKDNFKLQANETDSELSEWTDSDEEADDDNSLERSADESQTSPSSTRIVTLLKPLERPIVIKTLKLEDPEKWLRENIQHSWWSTDTTSMDISSSHPSANFCEMWQKHLCDKSLGFIKPHPVSLITEYCLLREIFWMFHNPVDCKFFRFDETEIVLRSDVTLRSTMPDSLHIFLNDILRSINLMYRLMSHCIRSYQVPELSTTMETYFNVVRDTLDEILKFVLNEEEIVKEQQQTYTIVILHNKLRPHAVMLEMLWNIHSNSVLLEKKFPPHICASYLLARLNQQVLTACKKEKKNLAIKLLMSCLRTYLEIFEIWCTEARFEDLKHEFLMEKVEDHEGVEPRPLVKCKEKSFYLNDSISSRITSDPIVTTMLNYSKKASFTLDIIGKLDRVHEMRQIVNECSSLYEEFVMRVKDEIRKFSQHHKPEINADTDGPQPDAQTLKNQKLVDDIRSGMLANGDHLLLLAFEATFNQLTKVKAPSQSEDLYEELNEATDFILLPLERSILRIMNELLEKKISIAERFVMSIYIHEFHVDQDLQEIRKVFFLESHELTNFFHLKLFPQMEVDEPGWADPYKLTVALNDAICHSRQQTSTLFSVEVAQKFSRCVLDSVDGITLFFNVNKNLVNVFTPEAMQKYNEGESFAMSVEVK